MEAPQTRAPAPGRDAPSQLAVKTSKDSIHQGEMRVRQRKKWTKKVNAPSFICSYSPWALTEGGRSRLEEYEEKLDLQLWGESWRDYHQGPCAEFLSHIPEDIFLEWSITLIMKQQPPLDTLLFVRPSPPPTPMKIIPWGGVRCLGPGYRGPSSSRGQWLRFVTLGWGPFPLLFLWA